MVYFVTAIYPALLPAFFLSALSFLFGFCFSVGLWKFQRSIGVSYQKKTLSFLLFLLFSFGFFHFIPKELHVLPNEVSIDYGLYGLLLMIVVLNVFFSLSLLNSQERNIKAAKALGADWFQIVMVFFNRYSKKYMFFQWLLTFVYALFEVILVITFFTKVKKYFLEMIHIETGFFLINAGMTIIFIMVFYFFKQTFSHKGS